ncbi:NAD(P)/FAD-dependent oxidoreductase [Methylococcus sp. EFPC2]|uniref:NAD(P)/FAD-dependent oxidoreductase n=1 Tax=Methylococcus sp. EFPC2 TaxID=2812648 RepID=UPI001967C4F9|nr:NAD(P)/FAD-dependent oxidoreductase [Methylococcus sp. EFPC2]QSA98323.1 NAD(P)/FAD-dependent oxidoreductase [Methylococcus sp. EFPC2]
MSATQTSSKPQIIIVGGGAGGLELATSLGKALGKKSLADVILIDSSRTHIWKPLLHEVAAGTLDSHDDELDYLAQAHQNHFRFVLGRMDGLDRAAKQVKIAPIFGDGGEEIVPARTQHYDTLVIAVGSICNDFGIPGADEHCLFLDTTEQAEQFQRRLLEAYLRANVHGGVTAAGELDIAIVGGGATGIELSAQLYQAGRLLNAYGLDNVKPEDIKLHLIEASNRLLPELPDRLSNATRQQLASLGVDILLGERVVEVTAEAMKTHSGRVIPAAIKVWAAGVKAPDFLREIDSLETNRLNQLVVGPTLQTTRDETIYAIGDCAACPWPEKGPEATVPPRAQSAHQMASLVHGNILRGLKGEPLKNYKYQDYGSLVSLGKFSTVGNLMGNLLGSVMIEGVLARLVYLSLYKMHQLALFGPFRVSLLAVSSFFRSRLRPKIKLH